MPVSKHDLVLKIADATGLRQKDIAELVQMTLDGIADAIVKDGNVELRNFGIFELVTRQKRTGRNPKKPEKSITIPAHTAIKFKSGKELKKRLEKLNPKRLRNKS
jgi:DNA-binding protein HU-beta/integration host factor subunit beta